MRETDLSDFVLDILIFGDHWNRFTVQFTNGKTCLVESMPPKGNSDSSWAVPTLRALWLYGEKKPYHRIRLSDLCSSIDANAPDLYERIYTTLIRYLSQSNRLLRVVECSFLKEYEYLNLRRHVGIQIRDCISFDEDRHLGTCIKLVPPRHRLTLPEMIAYPPIMDSNNAKAVKEYYDEGDTDLMRFRRRRIYFEAEGKPVPKGTPTRDDAVSGILCFLEKWAQLTRRGYLPIDVFNGPSGYMVARMLLYCRADIEAIRTIGSNTLYSHWHAWLVQSILQLGFLNGLSPTVKGDIEQLANLLHKDTSSE